MHRRTAAQPPKAVRAADEDTIAAIASASGSAGVGIVRVSGARAPAIARELLGRVPRPRYAHLVELRESDGALLDQALLLHFPAPHSYTGQHVLELQVHGNPHLLQSVLRRVVALGARIAEPGEFTRRAFLSGKLDLAQAEAVADLIAARSETALRAAQRSLSGEFSRRVDALFESLVQLRLQVEAAMDFPEEEIDFPADGAVAAQLSALLFALDTLLGETRRGQRLRDGLHVVIVGPPNAGKSSLLNVLAGQDRAIVADAPGTTRDLLREQVRLDGVELTLVDTAGLRASDDAIEQEGMRRARHELAQADLALVLLGPDDGEAEPMLRAEVGAVPRTLWLNTKSDLVGRQGDAVVRDGLRISVRDGTGLSELATALREAAGLGEGAEGAFSARTRHVDALERVDALLRQAGLSLEAGAAELAAEDLRLAQQALAQVTGAFSSDDLLGRIFSSFCIGK